MSPTSQITLSVDTVRTDVDYVTSDLHLDHQNMIKFCRSDTFTYSEAGLAEMNETLIERWNQTIDPDETVVYCGDFGWFYHTQEDRDAATEYWEQLNGDIVCLRGDHDHIRPDGVSKWLYAAEIQYNRIAYFVSHLPGDTPEELPGKGMPGNFRDELPVNIAERFNGWRIHGHHHNNWPGLYPLVNPDRRTINCSVELTGYRPVSVATIDQLVRQNEWVHSV
jgi:calcineurin-like phosphoesterase family protein